MTDIEGALDKVAPHSRGVYRFVIVLNGVRFFSLPEKRERFIELWHNEMSDSPYLSAVEYESRTEYTPGNYMWEVI